MKTIPHRHHAAGKRKIRQRLDRPVTAPSPEPVLTATHIHFEAATKTQAIACGGIGAIPRLVRKLGRAEAIDQRLHLLKFPLPDHESDHVLNFAIGNEPAGTDLSPSGRYPGHFHSLWTGRRAILPAHRPAAPVVLLGSLR